jgi:hypothetical protein
LEAPGLCRMLQMQRDVNPDVATVATSQEVSRVRTKRLTLAQVCDRKHDHPPCPEGLVSIPLDTPAWTGVGTVQPTQAEAGAFTLPLRPLKADGPAQRLPLRGILRFETAHRRAPL